MSIVKSRHRHQLHQLCLCFSQNMGLRIVLPSLDCVVSEGVQQVSIYFLHIQHCGFSFVLLGTNRNIRTCSKMGRGCDFAFVFSAPGALLNDCVVGKNQGIRAWSKMGPFHGVRFLALNSRSVRSTISMQRTSLFS